MPWPGGTVFVHHIASLRVVISNLKVSPRWHTNEGTGTRWPGGVGRNKQVEGMAGGPKGTAFLARLSPAPKEKLGNCHLMESSQWRSSTATVPRSRCSCGTAAPCCPPPSIAHPLHPTILPRLWSPGLNPTIKLIWVEGKTHEEGGGKALGGKGRVTSIMMLFKAGKQGQVSLWHQGWEQKGSRGNPKPAWLPKPLAL